MFGRSAFAATVILSLIFGASQAQASGKEKEGGGAGNEIQAKLSGDYVAVPPLHMAVQVDANRNYRSLELEVWLLQAEPEKHQILSSKKKLIAQQMKEDFAAYNWEAFEDSAEGPVVAKRIVAASVQRITGVSVQDVMIKTLVLK